MSLLIRHTFDLRSRVSHEPSCRTCFVFYAASDVDAAIAQVKQEVWEEAAQLSEAEGLAAGLPSDRWDQGYRMAASNIANIMREQAAKVTP